MINTLNYFIFNLIKSNINDFKGLNYYNDFIPKNTNPPYLYLKNISIEKENIFNKNIQTITNKIHIVNNEFSLNQINIFKSNLLKLLLDNNLINKKINDNYKILEIIILNQDINTLISNTKTTDFIIAFKVILEVL